MKEYRRRLIVLNKGLTKSVSRTNDQNDLLKLGLKQKSLVLLLGFWAFSIVWYSREHDVSETGSVSVLR
jgi:hypothetical protein